MKSLLLSALFLTASSYSQVNARLHAGETITAALDSILVKLIKITHR